MQGVHCTCMSETFEERIRQYREQEIQKKKYIHLVTSKPQNSFQVCTYSTTFTAFRILTILRIRRILAIRRIRALLFNVLDGLCCSRHDCAGEGASNAGGRLK